MRRCMRFLEIKRLISWFLLAASSCHTLVWLWVNAFSLHQPRMKRGYDPCNWMYAIEYFNLPEVQKALHANETRIPYAWNTCRYRGTFVYVLFLHSLFVMDWRMMIKFMFSSTTVANNWGDAPISMFPIYQELLEAGLRIWVYKYVFQLSDSFGSQEFAKLNWLGFFVCAAAMLMPLSH